MGKFWLFGAAIEAGYVWLAVIGVLNSAVSLYYYIRIVVYMMLKNEPSGSEPRQSPSLGFAMGVAVVGDLASRHLSAAVVRVCRGIGPDPWGFNHYPDDRGKTAAIRAEIRGFLAGELFHKVCYIQRA